MRGSVRAGISLVELLVVIAIIVLVCTLAFPAVQTARDSARRLQCSSNLYNIGRAMIQYEVIFGVFPPASVGCDGSFGTKRNGQPSSCGWCPARNDRSLESDATRSSASSFVLILPYLEQQSLYNLASLDTTGLWKAPRFYQELDKQWQTPQALQLITTRPAVYVCPSDPSEPFFPKSGIPYYVDVEPATGSYAVCGGTRGPRGVKGSLKCTNDGMFLMAKSRSSAQITDGLSNTFLGGEVQASDSDASRNVWSNAIRMADTWRSTGNPLNTAPAIHRLPYSGVKCLPQDAEDCLNGAFGSYHFWGANFLYADGHVGYVRDKIDMKVYNAFATIAGGEVISGKPTEIKQ